MPVTRGRDTWRLAKATHSERESRTYTYRSRGYGNVVELTEAREVKATGTYAERTSSSEDVGSSENSSSGLAVSDGSLGSSSLNERSPLQVMLDGPKKPPVIRTLRGGKKLSKMKKAPSKPLKNAIEKLSASHETIEVAETDLEKEVEEFETLRWCLLDAAEDEAYPNLPSSKDFQIELDKMNWAQEAAKASKKDVDSNIFPTSDEDENVPPPSSIVYANSRKQKFKKKRAYAPVRDLIHDWEARQALEAALESAEVERARRSYRPGGMSERIFW